MGQGTGTKKKRDRSGEASYRTGVAADGTMDCLCWCKRKVLHVCREVILAGRTQSCGAQGCSKDHPAARPKRREIKLTPVGP